MKHFIWMLCGIFVSGLLLGTLGGCGNELALSGPEPVLAAAGISEAEEMDSPLRLRMEETAAVPDGIKPEASYPAPLG